MSFALASSIMQQVFDLTKNRGNYVLDFKDLTGELISNNDTIESTSTEHINNGKMASKNGMLVKLKDQ